MLSLSTHGCQRRTGEEWRWVGHPGPNDLVESKNGKAKGLNYNAGANLVGKVANVAIKISAGDGTASLVGNPLFVVDVQEKFDYRETTLLTICRSGNRAKAAAEKLASIPFSADEETGPFDVYYVVDGFRGPGNDEDYPGRDTGYRDVAGWVNEGLPWNDDETELGYYVDYTPTE